MAGQSSAGGKLGCVLWSLLVIVGIMIGWKTIPVKIASSELYDFMIEQAKWAAGFPDEAIQKAIVEKADELDLPVDSKQVEVKKVGGHIRMRVEYDVPLDFPGYTYVWHFEEEVDRPIFIF